MLNYLPDSENARDRYLGNLKGLVLLLALIVVMVVLNIFQIASLVIYPFSRQTFKDVNRLYADWCCTWFVWVVERVHKVEFVFTGDKTPVRENVLIVANHQQTVDIPFLMSLGRRKKSLGNLKWFAKDIIKYIPGPGWGMHFIDCIFLKRNWAEDEESVKRTFHKITHYEIPVWIVMFCEGTRATEEKLALSREFAKEKGLYIPSYVMVPRTKGFAATVQGLRKHLHAVYDVTIGYPDGIPSLPQLLKGQVRQVHMHVRRIAMLDLPKEEDALADWLIETYYDKDQLMEHFYKEKKFPGPERDEPY